MIVKDIYLTRNDEAPVIEIPQETAGMDIVLRIVDWTVPAGATARIYVEKPSGLEIYNSCAVSGQTLTATSTTQMTAEPGMSKCQLQISSGDKSIKSFVFYLLVQEKIIDGSALESTSEYTALEQLIIDAQEAIDDCEDAAEEARSVTDAYITTFTHSRSSSGVHTLTNASYPNNVNIRFTATADWQEGDTMKVGSTSVACKTMDGKDLPPLAFKSGAAVFALRVSNTLYFPVTAEREASAVINLTTSATLSLRRKGTTVFCDAYLPGPWTGSARTFETPVPAGYRPITEQRSAAAHAYRGEDISNNVAQIWISTLGIVKMKCTDVFDSAWTFYFSFCWDTADEFPS